MAAATADSSGSDGIRTTRQEHLPGEVGTWVFILGDLSVFALLFGVFLYYRGQQPLVFAHAQAHLHKIFGLINTLLLLTSSLCVISAVRGIRQGARGLPPRLIVAAILCGLAFLVNKYLEWSNLIRHHHTPASNNFDMYFFVLTGIHAFHLLLGLGMLVGLLHLSRKEQLSPSQMVLLEGAACFWHMVDLLWIVLFALLYLVH